MESRKTSLNRHSFISNHHEEVLLYNCSFPEKMPSTEEYTMQIYQPAIRKGVLQVTAVPFQQQEEATDCSLFNIAVIYDSALSQDLARSLSARMNCDSTSLSALSIGSLAHFHQHMLQHIETNTNTCFFM